MTEHRSYPSEGVLRQPWLPGLLVLALCVSGACRSAGDRKDPARAAAVSACADTLSAVASVPVGARLQRLAVGCTEVCPRLTRPVIWPLSDHEQVTRVVEGCDGFCTAGARAAWNQASPDQAYAALVGACGPEAYGLNADSKQLFSTSWLFLLRTHEWLQANRRHATAAVLEQLARAGMHAHFAVPLPARARRQYQLAASEFGRPIDQALYVVVPTPEAAAIRAAAIPVARLRPNELEFRPVPGGAFPGQIMLKPAHQYRHRLQMLQDMHPSGEHSSIDIMPVLFIDQGASVTRLLDAMSALDLSQVALGVAGDVARAHPIIVERQITKSSGTPVLEVHEAEFVLLGTETVRIPEGDVESLGRALDELFVASTPPRKVQLVLDPGADADVATLVSYLDVLARSKFTVALVRDGDSSPRSVQQ